MQIPDALVHPHRCLRQTSVQRVRPRRQRYLDFSGFYQDQRIDLTPGTRSSVGGLHDNVFITSETLIENAIGGKGNDRISGNSADNILIGGAGADHLTGNGGFNTFSYHFSCDSPQR